jgi:hypothetical protein
MVVERAGVQCTESLCEQSMECGMKLFQSIGRMTTTYWSLCGKQTDEARSCGLPIHRPGAATISGQHKAGMEKFECFTLRLRAGTSRCNNTP